MIYLIRISGFALLLVTLLPLLSTGKWYVRYWDFPRLQIAVLLVAVLAIAIYHMYCHRSAGWETPLWTFFISVAIVWQSSHLVQFTPLWSAETPTADGNSETIRVMVVNLKQENDHYAEVADEISSERPEVLVLIEPDKLWMDKLADLRSEFLFHYDHVLGEGLGLALWSRSEILSAETRHLVSQRRASIWATLQGDDHRKINFVCVHPTPPGLDDDTGDSRRDSRVRDAELVLIAKEIAEQDAQAWIVAGDFNDVAWSHTTRLFKRISGLKDPRVGRTFMGTFYAQYPPFRCPLDHIFLSDGFSLQSLSRRYITGSDHFSVIADVHLRPIDIGVTPEPQGNDHQDAEEIIEEGTKDAQRREVALE